MTLRAHYWLTVLAIVIVFAAGSAFTWILFKDKIDSPDSKRKSEPAKLEVVPPKAWADATLDRLGKSLELRPEQMESVQRAINDAELEVAYVREGAMLEYYMLLLRLHDTIAEKVDEDQKAKLKESRESLERMFERRLSAISEELPGQTAKQQKKPGPKSEEGP